MIDIEEKKTQIIMSLDKTDFDKNQALLSVCT
jgi:hypothetical protein